jgi:membrane protease subunit HflC
VDFYEFTRTMQAYKDMISKGTTLVLSTDSDLFKFLRGMQIAERKDGGASQDLGASSPVSRLDLPEKAKP